MTEDQARTETNCKGCGETKDIGLVVCWDCFKGRNGRFGLKFWFGSFDGWILRHGIGYIITKGA